MAAAHGHDAAAAEKRELELEKKLLAESGDVEEADAVYAQQFVETIVPQTDDPDAPSLSLRAAVMGTLFAVALGLVNGKLPARPVRPAPRVSIFSFRTVSFTISSSVSTLLSYPIGIFLARVLPRGILNPGPFTIKEHVLVYMIAGAAGGQPYGIDNVVGQKFEKFLNDSAVTFWNSVFFILTTQMIGYGLSGMTRRYLVRPAAMYWPGVLPTVAMFVSFHETQESDEVKKVGGLSRYSFFWLVFCLSFVWQWIPSFFASATQALSILCFFTSASKTVRVLGSASPNMGVGMLSISLDWTNFGSFFMPLSTPWWVSVNYFVANVVILWVIVPLAYYNNWFKNPQLKGPYSFADGSPFPRLNSPKLFDKSGSQINPTKFYDRNDFSLNETAYDAVKPIYFTENFAVTYATSFLALTAGVTHIALWYHKDIIRQTKEMIAQVGEEKPDIHNELMKAYPDIPEWMYLSWLAFWLAMMFVVGYVTPYKLSWWGVIFGLVLAFFFTVPYGIIQGTTGQQLGLNIITELLMGLIAKGQTIQVMTFKSYGYNIMIQCLSLTADLKIGHYLHINPIHMVAAQLWGTLIGVICNTASVWIAISYFPLDSPDWLYTGHQTFFSAGAVWGAIGPNRFFGPDSPYFSLNLGYLFGFILPFLPWIGHKVFPHPYWRFVNVPTMTWILFTGYIESAVTTFFIVAFIFQYLVFTYNHGWWAKYNYVLSAALDTGTGIAVLVITLVQMQVTVPASAVNPSIMDYYCTGENWDAEQFA
ncbi:OPT superfamily [Polyrhizophydium stewartii]|uniref:OPT superfamily n=1 Tax=Polyrhizophydium stewartii TaxID=2732419 RepID=A0ABR4NCH1_9FUNG